MVRLRERLQGAEQAEAAAAELEAGVAQAEEKLEQAQQHLAQQQGSCTSELEELQPQEQALKQQLDALQEAQVRVALLHGADASMEKLAGAPADKVLAFACSRAVSAEQLLGMQRRRQLRQQLLRQQRAPPACVA
jgi:hypothetical protein